MSNLPEVLIIKIFNYVFYPHEMPFCKTYRYNKVIESLPLIEMNHNPYHIYHWYYDYYPNFNYLELRKQHLTGFGKPYIDDELRLMRNIAEKPYIIFSYVLRRFKNKALVEINETTQYIITGNTIHNPIYYENEYKSYIKEKKPICKDFLFEDDY